MSNTPDTANFSRRLRDQVAAVFDQHTRIGVCQISTADPLLLPETEQVAIQNAVFARKQEFAAGRIAARQALNSDTAIGMAKDRAPIWPGGIVASISHTADWAVAVTSPHARMLGLDIEEAQDLPQEALDMVLSAKERRWCEAQPHSGRAARMIFSIKEACYKAQYPLTQQLFGFEMFETRVSGPVFEAEFQSDVGEFRRGDIMPGRVAVANGLIVSGVLL